MLSITLIFKLAVVAAQLIFLDETCHVRTFKLHELFEGMYCQIKFEHQRNKIVPTYIYIILLTKKIN